MARPRGLGASAEWTRSDTWTLAGFLLAALLLRLPGHLDSGLWFDEIWLLVESVRVPFGSLFTAFESDNNHPLYSVLAWTSVEAFGERAWSLRLPAVLFGAASIGMTWRFALLVTDRREAALATALLALSYHHVWFSQNARGYTMLLFFTVAATHFLLRTYERGARRDWLAYAACLALATFTHASAVLVAAAHAMVSAVVVSRPAAAVARSREARWAPVLGIAAAGLLSILLHAGMLGDMLAFFGGGTATPPAEASAQPSEWTSLFWTVSAVVESLGVPAAVGWSMLVLGGALVLIGVAVVHRRDWRVAALYLLPGILTLLTTVAMGRSLRPRFFFHLSSFALLIVVAGVLAACGWISKRYPARRSWLEPRLQAVAAVGMILASLVILPRAYTLPKQDFEGALAYATEARAAGAGVATAGLTVLPYRDYYDAGFAELISSEDLDELLRANEVVYVLHTIPIYLESAAPDLAARLVPSREVARFRGSLGGGDVVVYRFEAGAADRP